MTSAPAAVDLEVLARLVAPVGRAVAAEPLSGGMFATTHRVLLDDGTRVVVKQAPAGDSRLLTHEHDLLRTEALVYGLAADRPALRMPRLLHVDLSRTVVEGDVVVASHLDGTPGDRIGLYPSADDARVGRLVRDLGAVVAELRTVTGPVFGYPGRPALQAPSWPEAFGLVVEALLADAARWRVEVPTDEVRAALVRHGDALAQVTRPSLVHTDLWPGNLFVDEATGALLGVIDPERALWGDPVLELSGVDAFGPAEPHPGLVAAAGLTLDADARRRLELYRMWMGLVMTVEVAPRGYTGDWVAGHRASVGALLRSALAALA